MSRAEFAVATLFTGSGQVLTGVVNDASDEKRMVVDLDPNQYRSVEIQHPLDKVSCRVAVVDVRSPGAEVNLYSPNYVGTDGQFYLVHCAVCDSANDLESGRHGRCRVCGATIEVVPESELVDRAG